jgi:hypothetical protein
VSSEDQPALSRAMADWLARLYRPPLYQRLDTIETMLAPTGRDGMAGGRRVYNPDRGPIYAAGAAGRERIAPQPAVVDAP